MAKAQFEQCYTSNKEVFVPMVKITESNPQHIYVPLRGAEYTMAVFVGQECIGWLGIATLGYYSVKEWMKATNWVDAGY